MKTKDLKFDYVHNVHSITRCLLSDYISKRVKSMISNKGFNSFGTISNTADLVASYNEICDIGFFVHANQFIRYKI